MTVRLVHEPPGEWHLGLWLNRSAFSIRIVKWALVFHRN